MSKYKVGDEISISGTAKITGLQITKKGNATYQLSIGANISEVALASRHATVVEPPKQVVKPTEDKPKLKVGDKVEVVNQRRSYATYVDWFAEQSISPSIAERFAHSLLSNGEVYTVIACGPHKTPGYDVLYAVEDGSKKVYLIGETGVKPYIEPKYKVGDKVKIVKTQHALKERYIGEVLEVLTINPNERFSPDMGTHYGIGGAFVWLEDELELYTEPQQHNGKVVCVENGGDWPWWTVGKVYSIVDGLIRDNNGDERTVVESIEQLNNMVAVSDVKFIEYKGEA